MIATIQIAVLLLVVVAAVAVAARRLELPPAILLVVVGVVLALVPGLPRVELVPELVLLLVLPPLIYSAGVAMSWREFRFNLRPITLLAIGCVVFTTVAVAAVGHALLGCRGRSASCSVRSSRRPTSVAPLAIARRLGLPRRTDGHPRGRGARQRRDGADPLPLRGRRGEHRNVLVRRPRSGRSSRSSSARSSTGCASAG